MTEEEKFNTILNEIREIFTYLTEDEPSPDEEIEARENLINLFRNIDNLNVFSEYKELIETILQKLEEWDTLDLWFLETKIPNDIRSLLKIPQKQEKVIKEEAKEPPRATIEQTIEKTEIDVTQIVNKVSEQFKGEIEGLKGKIEDLKKELEKKDKTLKSISQKKKIEKIIPKKESKLPLPKIKIPVIKKPNVAPKIITKPVTDKEKIEEIKIEPVKLEPIKIKSESNHKELTTIPDQFPDISSVAQEFEDIPIITEKRKITPIVLEKSEIESEEELKPEEKPSVIFSVDKPKIKSMKVEEIETESIKSSTTDLFNVFSSVGEKVSESKEKKTEVKVTEPEVKSEKKKSSQTTSFINFNKPKQIIKEEKITISEGELPSDKDSLYQELIALEGKRYSLEKSFKELDANYQRGSIADLQYKNQNDLLKNKLNEITLRINKIRRIISSL